MAGAPDPNRDSRARLRLIFLALGSLLIGGGVGEAFNNATAGWLIGGGLALVLLSAHAEEF